jgi:protocatechuate 3,4-dioxygenase beta subunit
MTHDSLTRRAAVAGSLAALGASAGAGAAFSQQGRVRPDLYNLEDSEQSLEWDERTITWRTRIAPLDEPGQSFTLSGRALSVDGGQPVAGVVVMAYHTNHNGTYPQGGTPRRITMRAWTRTGADGRYAFDTIKPGIYPSRDGPAHVHMTVIEPGKRPYWIDEVVFEGEYGVTSAYRAAQGRRGGEGTVRLTKDASGVLQAVRDIRLELHPA